MDIPDHKCVIGGAVVACMLLAACGRQAEPAPPPAAGAPQAVFWALAGPLLAGDYGTAGVDSAPEARLFASPFGVGKDGKVTAGDLAGHLDQSRGWHIKRQVDGAHLESDFIFGNDDWLFQATVVEGAAETFARLTATATDRTFIASKPGAPAPGSVRKLHELLPALVGPEAQSLAAAAPALQDVRPVTVAPGTGRVRVGTTDIVLCEGALETLSDTGNGWLRYDCADFARGSMLTLHYHHGKLDTVELR